MDYIPKERLHQIAYICNSTLNTFDNTKGQSITII